MKISKKTVPYSINECEWNKESKVWLFSWGEEIPDKWVKFSIKNQIPVECINEASEKDPTNFELDEDVIEEILADE